jgi:Flp pilus assembly protein TadD
LKDAAAERPENAEILYHLGMTQKKKGDDADAERVLKQAIALAPNAPWVAKAQIALKEQN